jgi:hypothetical protein
VIRIAEQAWQASLEKIEQRNGSIEVSAPADADGNPREPVFRTRLLLLDDEGLLIERPGGLDANRLFKPGVMVTVLFVEGDNRFEGDARVQRNAHYQLNRQTTVQAVRLSPLADVRSAQRRSHFRVSTVGSRFEPVVLKPSDDDHAGRTGDERPGDPPPPFEATMLNISGGGLGVETPQFVGKSVERVERYACLITLPTLRRPLVIHCRVKHRHRRDDGTYYLGLAFEFEDDYEQEACVDQVCHFTAWVQRQQLQRRRA